MPTPLTNLMVLLRFQVIDENAQLLEELFVEDYELAEDCLRTNYYGTKAVTTEMLPLLQLSNSARIVNVSSNYGELKVSYNLDI